MRNIFLKSDFPGLFNEIGEVIRSLAGACEIVAQEDASGNEVLSEADVSTSDMSESGVSTSGVSESDVSTSGVSESDVSASTSIGEGEAVLLCKREGQGIAARFQPWGGSETVSVRTIPVGRDALESKRFLIRAGKRAVFEALRPHFDTPTPWGCLTGIRPTKLARESVRKEGEEAARKRFAEEFLVAPDKIDLAFSIVRRQESLLASIRAKDFDLYVGIPFCPTRCHYCSFASYPIGKGARVEAYLEALQREVRANLLIAQREGWRVRSVYIGGGTPTALRCDQLEGLLEHVLEGAGGYGLEFTVEAGRPDSIDADKLRALKVLGVTRLSVNPQTMNAVTLERMGRAHTPEQVVESVWLARSLGYTCLNMDLIVGLPGENEAMVERTLEEIQKLAPENLTVHTLAIKRSSKLKEQLDETPLPNAETAARMVALSRDMADRMGLKPYYMYRQKYMSGNLENVGYASSGMESVYNVDIMEETVPILALGAGAISKWNFEGGRIERVVNPKDIDTYIAKIDAQTECRAQLMRRDS